MRVSVQKPDLNHLHCVLCLDLYVQTIFVLDFCVGLLIPLHNCSVSGINMLSNVSEWQGVIKRFW